MFLRPTGQPAEAEGIAETLKADCQTEWVGRMNNVLSNVLSRAIEIVCHQVIYTE